MQQCHPYCRAFDLDNQSILHTAARLGHTRHWNYFDYFSGCPYFPASESTQIICTYRKEQQKAPPASRRGFCRYRAGIHASTENGMISTDLPSLTTNIVHLTEPQPAETGFHSSRYRLRRSEIKTFLPPFIPSSGRRRE